MLNKIFNKFILPVVVPVIIIIMVFKSGFLYGIASILVYIAIILIWKRERVYTILGTRKYHEKKMDKALHYFEKILKLNNPRPRNIIYYGYILLKTGDIKKAESVFNRILSMKLDKSDKNYANSIVALLYWKQGNLDKAITLLEETIKEYETTTIYGSLGYLYIESGNLDKALEFNLSAYDYNDDDPIILDNLAQVYLLLGDIKKAEKILSRLMPKEPKFPEAYYNYAKYQKEKGLYEEALGSLNKALEFDISYLSAISKNDIETFIEEIKKLHDKGTD
jgi:tetratricopeptide (TPR) repeat protein